MNRRDVEGDARKRGKRIGPGFCKRVRRVRLPNITNAASSSEAASFYTYRNYPVPRNTNVKYGNHQLRFLEDRARQQLVNGLPKTAACCSQLYRIVGARFVSVPDVSTMQCL